MRMPSELRLLGELRAQGKAPELPIYLTDLRGIFTENMLDVGTLVIPLYDGADAWDWSPLAGLAVVLAFRNPGSDRSIRVALSVKEARPRWLRVIDWTAEPAAMFSPFMPITPRSQ